MPTVNRTKPVPTTKAAPSLGKKPTGTANRKSKPRNISSSREEGLSLPTELSTPIQSIEEATFFVYGERKIGKTSLCARFQRPMFLMFEPGGKGLRIFQRPVNLWDEYLEYSALLLESDYSTVVFDTIDIAYVRCQEYVCRREGINHPNDKPHGTGWDLVRKEFNTEIERLIKAGKGVVFTSHATVMDFQKPSGLVFNKLVPSASAQARRFAAGIADVIGYYGYYGDDRYLTIEGSDTLEAGNRLEENFIAKNKRKVHSIPMGKSADEAYQNLLRAFRNEQATSGKPEGLTGLSEKRAIRARKG